jgi:hypothetical protein
MMPDQKKIEVSADLKIIGSQINLVCKDIAENAFGFIFEIFEKQLGKELDFTSRLDLLLAIIKLHPFIPSVRRALDIVNKCKDEVENLILSSWAATSSSKMQLLGLYRLQGRFHKCLGDLPRSDLAITIDSVVKELLLSEICWDKHSTAKKIQDLVNIRTKKGKCSEQKDITLACKAFIFEALAGESRSKDDCFFYLYKSMESMRSLLCWEDQEAASHLRRNCFDAIPEFVTLAEKSIVVLIIRMKEFKDILLPLNLAVDVLSKPNAGLVQFSAFLRDASDSTDQKPSSMHHDHTLNLHESFFFLRDIVHASLTTLCLVVEEKKSGQICSDPFEAQAIRILTLAISTLINIGVSDEQARIVHHLRTVYKHLSQPIKSKGMSRIWYEYLRLLSRMRNMSEILQDFSSVCKLMESQIVCMCANLSESHSHSAFSSRFEKYLATVFQQSVFKPGFRLVPFELYQAQSLLKSDQGQGMSSTMQLESGRVEVTVELKSLLNADAADFVPSFGHDTQLSEHQKISGISYQMMDQVRGFKGIQSVTAFEKYHGSLRKLAVEARQRVAAFEPLDILIRRNEKSFLSACDENGSQIYSRIHPMVQLFMDKIAPLQLKVHEAVAYLDSSLPNLRIQVLYISNVVYLG